MVSVFEKCYQFFDVTDMLIETVNIIYFFSNLCFKSKFHSNGADGYNLSHYCSI